MPDLEKNTAQFIDLIRRSLSLTKIILNTAVFSQILNKLSGANIDIVILS